MANLDQVIDLGEWALTGHVSMRWAAHLGYAYQQRYRHTGVAGTSSARWNWAQMLAEANPMALRPGR